VDPVDWKGFDLLIGLSILGSVFWIPVIGVVLSLLDTIGVVIWYGLMARDLVPVGWGQTDESPY
jgi:hypothetical protein